MELAQSFGIQSIPTLILFKKGKAEKTSVGLVSKQEILDMIDNFLQMPVNIYHDLLKNFERTF